MLQLQIRVGFFFLRAGGLWRVAYLTGISLLASPCYTPMCLPFLGEVKYLQTCLLNFHFSL